MLKAIQVFIILFPAIIGYSQDFFEIKGTTSKKFNDKFVYLRYQKQQAFTTDSFLVKQQSFSFKDSFESPRVVYLFTYDKYRYVSGSSIKEIFISNTVMNVHIKSAVKEAEIENTPYQPLHDEYVKGKEKILNNHFFPAMTKLTKATRKNDEEKIKLYKDELENVNKLFLQYEYDFFEKNKNSPVGINALKEGVFYNNDPQSLESHYHLLPEKEQLTPFGKSVKKKFETLTLTAIGKPLPHFTQNDAAGKPVSIADFKGKYVLIDFWASWCGPCRAENPNLLQVYEIYKNRQFEIIGISLDAEKQKEAWLKAIETDKMYWTQLSDLKGWQNEVAVLFDIKYIPQNILINPEGIIIAKNLRANDLKNKIRSLFESN